ncbi:MAG: hypothetical protein J5640_07370 [Bacteroidales bacterium]|nr:hypothetical protein [Bacteroidales bacterium]
MVTNLFKGAYSAPVCELSEKYCESVLCESPEGLTEDFGGFEDFTW